MHSSHMREIPVVATDPQKPGKARRHENLAEKRPDLAQQWIQERNGDVTPESVPAGSDFRVAWRCGKCCERCRKPHEWHATVSHRCLGGTGCPMCSGRILCRCQSVAELRPDLLKQWHYERNRGINPETLRCSSRRKVFWTCKAHGPWSAGIDDRVHLGTECPICAWEERRGCSHPKRGLVKDDFPDVWRQIHRSRNEGIHVSSLTCGSHKKLVWLCQENKESRLEGCKCEHAWKAWVHNRCAKVKRRQAGCPFCSGRAVGECLSIAKLQPELMQYWCSSLNGKLDPKATGVASNKRVWWEHLCVDGKLRRRQLRVDSVVRNLQKAGRFPCRDCAGQEMSALHAEHHAHGRLGSG